MFFFFFCTTLTTSCFHSLHFVSSASASSSPSVRERGHGCSRLQAGANDQEGARAHRQGPQANQRGCSQGANYLFFTLLPHQGLRVCKMLPKLAINVIYSNCLLAGWSTWFMDAKINQ